MDFYDYVVLFIGLIFAIKFVGMDMAMDKIKASQKQIFEDMALIIGQLSIFIMSMPKEEYSRVAEMLQEKLKIKIDIKKSEENKQQSS